MRAQWPDDYYKASHKRVPPLLPVPPSIFAAISIAHTVKWGAAFSHGLSIVMSTGFANSRSRTFNDGTRRRKKVSSSCYKQHHHNKPKSKTGRIRQLSPVRTRHHFKCFSLFARETQDHYFVMVMKNRPVDPGSIQGSHRPISFMRIKYRTRANDLL